MLEDIEDVKYGQNGLTPYQYNTVKKSVLLTKMLPCCQ